MEISTETFATLANLLQPVGLKDTDVEGITKIFPNILS
jgi:hypothetical protein